MPIKSEARSVTQVATLFSDPAVVGQQKTRLLHQDLLRLL